MSTKKLPIDDVIKTIPIERRKNAYYPLIISTIITVAVISFSLISITWSGRDALEKQITLAIDIHRQQDISISHASVARDLKEVALELRKVSDELIEIKTEIKKHREVLENAIKNYK